MRTQSKNTKKVVLLLTLFTTVKGLRADGETKMAEQHSSEEPYLSMELQGATDAAVVAHVEITRVWRQRFERDVAPDLMRFLDHKWFIVRFQAAIFLSYLDHAPAEEPLRLLLERPTEKAALDMKQRRLQIQLALARIRTRDLRGQARVEAIAASIGRTLDTLTPASNRERVVLNQAPPEDAIKRAFFELLYSMAKKGEDIAPLRSKLRFPRYYNLLLDSAALPIEEEVTRVLDRLEKQVIGGGGFLSDSYLPRMGRRGFDVLLKRLQDMVEHPELHFRSIPPTPQGLQSTEEAEKLATKMGIKRDFSHLRRPHYAMGYVEIFHAAALSDDARFLPVLKQLEEKFRADPDPNVWDAAESAQQMLRKRLRLLRTLDEAATTLPK